VRLAVSGAGSPLQLNGPIDPQPLQPGEHRRLDIAIIAERSSLEQPRPCALQLFDRAGKLLTTQTVYLTRALTDE